MRRRFIDWLCSARVCWVLAWLLAVYASSVALYFAWHDLGDPERVDGNYGHASIDFGGQWLMGRMLLEGHADELYSRGWHRDILQRFYPDEDAVPGGPGDVAQLMGWMQGTDGWRCRFAIASCVTPLASRSPLELSGYLALSETAWSSERMAAVTDKRRGGPLYPPVHAFVMAPIATMPPRTAYRFTQILTFVITVLLGGLIHHWTRGRVWWPLTIVLLMIFPGYAGAINLGQNALFSLALLLVGWWLLSRERPFLAGCTWGLLAFKPVWAVAFFLVPLLSRRWWMALGMGTVGAAAILITLPFTGFEPWFDWFAIGQKASAQYSVDHNWIILSRDLQNIPRRYLLDFPDQARAASSLGLLPDRLGMAFWLGAIVLWGAVLFWRRRDPFVLNGPAACFLLLGAFFSCFHFMYYDSLLAACPVFLLFAGYAERYPESRWPYPVVPTLLMIPLFGFPYFNYYVYPEWRYEPFDTLLLLLLWLWCGWTWSRQGVLEKGDASIF